MTLPGLPFGSTAVDCGSCRACCKGMIVILGPDHGDDVSDARGDWEWRVYGLTRVRQLKAKRNGDCIHLTRKGCAIYDTRPMICKVFDCAAFVRRRENIRTCDNGAVIREGMRRNGKT